METSGHRFATCSTLRGGDPLTPATGVASSPGGMDAISHILQMWEAKHYRKLHDVWRTQYESISVGNFALVFTTTLLAPTLAREFQADDSFGLFTEAWLVALKRSGTTWRREMAAVFERAATAAHAMLVPLG